MVGCEEQGGRTKAQTRLECAAWFHHIKEALQCAQIVDGGEIAPEVI
jgi:hypothetical protein